VCCLLGEIVATISPSELVEEVEELTSIILPPKEVLRLGLKLRIRVCRGARCVESVGIANSGSASRESEIVTPQELLRELLGEVASVLLVERVLADGSRVLIPELTEPLEVYLVVEDRVEGPVKSYAYTTREEFILLNDALYRIPIPEMCPPLKLSIYKVVKRCGFYTDPSK